jgi:hypothetical protein
MTGNAYEQHPYKGNAGKGRRQGQIKTYQNSMKEGSQQETISKEDNKPATNAALRKQLIRLSAVFIFLYNRLI